MPLRLKVLTAGCKSNFADSSAIVREALARGYEIAPGDGAADVVVVNGCTVTHRADRDSRALARKARRENPGCRIVVTGCYAEARLAEAPRLPEADLWIPPSGDRGLARFLEEEAAHGGGGLPPSPLRATVHESDLLLGHRRTFLKVQDGCDSSCAYCAIPLARGRERSVPPDEVLLMARKAEQSGAREIVLTGIHVGRYGADRGEKDGLSRLLAALVRGTERPRFRLGSVEPLEVTPALLSVASGEGRVCPHFHVPLQSGSDAVLRRMGRPYGAGGYREALGRIRRAVPSARIGADVIAAFPGETEGEFLETLALVGEEGVDYLHPFPYSSREGTAAARLPDDVPPAEKKRRVGALLEADRAGRERDMERRIGTVEELFAEGHDGATGFLRGTTGSYHALSVPGAPEEEGTLVPVRIRGRSGRTLLGERLP